MKTTIEMAREAGFHISGQHAHSPYIEGSSLTHVLTRFAEIVAAGEREACAKVADRYVMCDPIAAAIRKRETK